MEEEIPCKARQGSEGSEGDICPTRITLRPLDPTDVEDFMVWAGDERVTRFCTWEPYTSREEALRFINDKAVPHPWFRAICLDGKAIGAVSVGANTGLAVCSGELGYVLGFRYWGKGVATVAVRLVVESVFKDWPHLERLEALVDVENVGSQKVLHKCGFLREGLLRKYSLLKGKTRDMFIFSRLSTD